MTTFTLNRRTLLTGTVALGTVGLLAACGGGSDKKISGKAASSTEEIVKNLEINKQDRSSLKQGGEFRGSVSAVGPNFNILTQSGYTTENLTAFGGACNIPSAIGFTSLSPAGDYSLNDDYVSDYKAETVDGVQTITFKLNSKAVFNDGTPVDIEAIRAAWTVYRNPDDGYNVIAAPFWQQVASIDPVDGDKTRVKIVMSKPLYPAETLGLLGLHPALTDKELFNNGFVNKPMDQYWSGPFKIGEWNSSAKTLTLVPNDKWWGEKPKLDRILVREMADAAARAAYKNGELDVVESRTLSAYNEMKDVANSEIRRGRRLFAGGMNLNAEHITDVAVRKAIFLGIDRGALAKIRFQGLPYEEEVPGSMLLLGSSQYYRDNYPARNPEEARKVLEKAGYTKSGDFYAKDGKTITLKLTTFGDDATTKGQAQTFIQSMKEIGINFELDSRAQSEFSKVVGNREYDVSISGFGVGSEPTSAAEYFYHSKNWNGVGTPEIDAMVDEMVTILDDAKRAEKCNEIEKKHMSEVCLFIPFLNGPDFKACRPKLANYGAFLFKSLDWSSVGWMA